ncbi:hypothetical protein ACQCS9_27735, partial [Ralstonia pseudosolanacearum]
MAGRPRAMATRRPAAPPSWPARAPPAASDGRSMLAKRLFRSGLTLLAVFAVVWMATIAWWQATHRMPTT